MSELATCSGLAGEPEALAARHAPALLADALQGAGSWTSTAPGYYVFRALLQTAGADMLAEAMPLVSEGCAGIGAA